MIDDHAAYRALKSHDPRFDGVFFVGVTSTGIYCRPVCPAKTPLRKNCLFFQNASLAEKASFRPCLRCRPELAPGNAPVDKAHRIAHLITRGVDEGLAGQGVSLEQIAAQFGISSRHLRRIVQKELGVSPVELLQTRRLLLAKQLLTVTGLPVTEIAFASGFSSLRRFNDAFRTQYQMPPSRLRKNGAERQGKLDPGRTSTLRLTYRPPFNWAEMLGFLAGRAILGVEFVTGESYARTARMGPYTGWIRVTHSPKNHALMVEFTHSLSPALPALLGRLRNLFDLTARPDLIDAHLGKHSLLRTSILKNPGLRVPGAFDGFEMAVRAILGQQITVRAATTISGRFAEAFGEKIETPVPELTRLSPLATHVLGKSVGDIVRLGIVSARATAILALARAFEAGSIKLDAGTTPEADIERLVALPGVGPWTASYIAMRASRWPDAFPKEDIAIRKRLGDVSAKRAGEISQAWQPWRSYAAMHLWKTLPPGN